MKKIISLTLAGLFAATSAFAAAAIDGTYSAGDASGTWTINATNVGTGVTFTTKLSANVSAAYKADTTASPNGGLFYAMATSHSSGTKSYASSSGESRLFMKEAVAATFPAAASSGIDWTGWTSVK